MDNARPSPLDERNWTPLHSMRSLLAASSHTFQIASRSLTFCCIKAKCQPDLATLHGHYPRVFGIHADDVPL
ncbi:hypothetical protein Hypma_004503 [Hypsizygus marmoreus]|uniref:Uncharacterized protein n=1 Tax=Hypsizygus marmoreus TaxID=39966 RepID=A0A369K412_HYPMA|nr:hypothetical protein Hypma_004503 [Hypsizygus marmoreus]